MDSPKTYSKVCQHCGRIFQTTEFAGKFCSDACAKKAYKVRRKQQFQAEESAAIKEQRRKELAEKENLSITEAAQLLGVSRNTIYSLIDTAGIQLMRISKRTIRIRREDLDKLYDSKRVISPLTHSIQEIEEAKAEQLISRSEIIATYEISDAYFFKKMKENGIKCQMISGIGYYPQADIKRLFKKPSPPKDLSDYYSVDELCEKFNMNKQTVYSYVSQHKTPKIKQDGKVYISRIHWNREHGLDPQEQQEYYTIEQITEKYGITRNHLYQLIKDNRLKKIQRGTNILVLRTDIDAYFSRVRNK